MTDNTDNTFTPPSTEELHRKTRSRTRYKRTKMQRQMDLVDTARLWLTGYTILQIRDWINANRDYNLHYNSIFNDLRHLRTTWRETYLMDTKEAMAQELARIDALEAEYWDAWRESRTNSADVETTDKKDEWSGRGRGTKPGYTGKKTVKKVSKRDGNPKFLEGIEKCIAMRMKLFGLEAPKNVNINWRKQAEEMGVDPDGVVDDLAQQFVRAAMAGGGQSGGMEEGTEDS